MGCDQCQNSLSENCAYFSQLGVCVLTCWKQVVCIAEMGGMQKWGVCVVGMWGMYISCKNGGMCCGNVGYVYQLQKWENVLWKCGVCISCRNGGMCCGNEGYVSVAEMGGMYCRNGGMCYGNGGDVSVAEWGYICVVEMGCMCCGNVGYVSVAEIV